MKKRSLSSLCIILIATMLVLPMTIIVEDAEAEKTHLSYYTWYREVQDSNGNTCSVTYQSHSGPHTVTHSNHTGSRTHYVTYTIISTVDECPGGNDGNDGSSYA